MKKNCDEKNCAAREMPREVMLTPEQELEILTKDLETYQIEKTIKIAALREIMQSFTGVDALIKKASVDAYNSIIICEMATKRKTELENKIKGENK